MLSSSAHTGVVCWSQDGGALLIKDLREFIAKVLPSHFNHSNYASFVRQLNLYGFRKCIADGEDIAFQQPLFRRDCGHLLSDIKRKVSVSRGDLTRTAKSLSDSQRVFKEMQEFQKIQYELKADSEALGQMLDSLNKQNSQLIKELSAVHAHEEHFENVLTLLANSLKGPHKQLDATQVVDAFHLDSLSTEDFLTKPSYASSHKQPKVKEVVDDMSSRGSNVSKYTTSQLTHLVLATPAEFIEDFMSKDFSFEEMLC
jgi:hypothetical protein